jgi:hypothetical protein
MGLSFGNFHGRFVVHLEVAGDIHAIRFGAIVRELGDTVALVGSCQFTVISLLRRVPRS